MRVSVFCFFLWEKIAYSIPDARDIFVLPGLAIQSLQAENLHLLWHVAYSICVCVLCVCICIIRYEVLLTKHRVYAIVNFNVDSI